MNSKQMTALTKDIEKIILTYDKLGLDTGVIVKVLKHNTVLKDDLIKHIEGMRQDWKSTGMPLADQEIKKHEQSYNQALQDILDYLRKKC